MKPPKPLFLSDILQLWQAELGRTEQYARQWPTPRRVYETDLAASIFTEHAPTMFDFVEKAPSRWSYPRFIRPVAEAGWARARASAGLCSAVPAMGNIWSRQPHTQVSTVLCWNLERTGLGRKHDDANMLSLGERMVPLDRCLADRPSLARHPLRRRRHARRIAEIDEPQTGGLNFDGMLNQSSEK